MKENNLGSKVLCSIFGLCAFLQHANEVSAVRPDFRVLFQWSQLEFDYASDYDRQRDIDSGFFRPGVPAPIDVDVYYGADKNSKIFVSIPRFQDGNPVALGVVSKKKYQNQPIIVPYPSWDWHREPTHCRTNRIISVYRTAIDECGRLWVLDNGRYGSANLICPPQILAFDLQTDRLVYRYEIPRDQYEDRSIYVTPVVDVRNKVCENAYVYAADAQSNRLLVLDTRRSESWIISDKTMYPDPEFGTYRIDGHSFDLMDGILGMALTPNINDVDRRLFFHAMSSNTENYVYTSQIRDGTRFRNQTQAPEIFHQYSGHRKSQSAAEAINKHGIMFFGDMSPITIECWDTIIPYASENFDVVGHNRETMQFPSGVKVITNKKGGEELWVLTSRFQRIGDGTLSTRETNFRILVAPVEDLLHGTKCVDTFGNHGSNHHAEINPNKPWGSSSGGANHHHHHNSGFGGYN